MPKVNEILADESVAHAINLQQYAIGVARRMVATLNRSDARIMVELAIALERMDPESFTVARLEALLVSVRVLNADVYRQAFGLLETELVKLAEFEAGYQYDLFNGIIPEPVQIRFPLAPVAPQQAYAAAMARPFQGRLLREWAQAVETDRMTLVRNAVRQGFVEGKTAAQIVNEIRGTRANNYADGFLQRPRRELMTVVQTAVSHTAATARDQFQAANSDIIKAVQWVSTLDSKTSPMCRVRDYLKYEAQTHKPIGHKVPWLAGPGRLHFNAVPAGSIIKTSCGAKPIEQVQAGDLVLTHTGSFKAVTDTRSKVNKIGVIREIHMKSGRVLRATDDHPILVAGRGWRFVGAVEIGDALFCDPEQPPEKCSVGGAVVSDSKDSPTVSDQGAVALGRTIKLAAASIDFKGDHNIGPSEIEDVVCRAVLENPSVIECQSRFHYLLALADLLGKHGRHALGKLLSSLVAHGFAEHSPGHSFVEPCRLFGGQGFFNDAIHAGGVVGLHPLRMGGMNFAVFFGHAVSPVVSSAFRFSAACSKVMLALFGLVSDRVAHDFCVFRKGAIGQIIGTLDGSQRQTFLDMINKNELAVVGEFFRHDVVVSLQLSAYHDMVYDLAVQGDASYVCNGIVVSNCRSTDAPVTKSWRELGIPVDEMTPTQRASMDGQVPAETTYADWLKRQSAGRQDQILGPERGRLMREGGLQLPDFYDSHGNWLNLDELKQREKEAFAAIAD